MNNENVEKVRHTPGPWKARKIQGYTAYWSVDAPRVEDREPQICKVSGGLYIDAPQTEANARLIAAAPDLLAALADICSHINEWGEILQGHEEDALAACVAGEKLARKARGE
jgi:hypothetical protein